jgi:hypothetical protein
VRSQQETIALLDVFENLVQHICRSLPRFDGGGRASSPGVTGGDVLLPSSN